MRTHHLRCPLALTLALAVLFIANGPSARGQDAVIPLIQMQEVSLNSVIENLARQAGFNFIIDPKLAGPTFGPDGKAAPSPSVTIRWENLTAKQALTRLLDEHGLCAVESPVSSVTKITYTNQNHVANPVDKAWVAGGTNAAIPLMQMQDAPLNRALENLAREARLDVVLDPQLSNPPFVPGKRIVPTPMVSFRWEKLTARQAMAALCENYNLVLEADAATGGVRITPK